jgi:hypothetical protein
LKDSKFIPKSYPETDIKENMAVNIFNNLIDISRIKSFINTRDKIPNHDGNIEIFDSNNQHVGFIFAQVKGLHDDKLNPPKHPIETSFFGFCKSTNVPTLFIGVDCINKKAYWLYFDYKEIGRLEAEKSTQKIITFTFPEENVIDGNNIDYISQWEKILEDFKGKIQDFEPMKEENMKLRETIGKIPFEEIGNVDNNYINMHVFLDTFNSLLDGPFSIVKRKKYHNPWKIGLLYYQAKSKVMGYTLYPIEWNKNDLLLKKGNKTLWNELVKKGYGEQIGDDQGIFMKNPINFASYLLYEKLKDLLDNKKLDFNCNTLLATEYVFAFIDTFYCEMGLEKKDTYSLSEIEFGYYTYFPLWLEETIEYFKQERDNQLKNLLNREYFKPSTLSTFLTEKHRETVEKRVNDRINHKQFKTRSYIVVDDTFSFRDFINYLKFLKKSGEELIQRPYRKSKSGTGNIYSDYTDDDIQYNVLKFIENLPEVYDDVIQKNFPELSEDLNLFKDVSRIIVIYTIRRDYHEPRERFSLKFIYLESDDALNKFDIFSSDDSEIQSLLTEDYGDIIEFENKTYRISRVISGYFDLIFSSTPLLKFIYKKIKEGTEVYFKDVIEWNRKMIEEWLASE